MFFLNIAGNMQQKLVILRVGVENSKNYIKFKAVSIIKEKFILQDA